jgi:hypothetical protein
LIEIIFLFYSKATKWQDKVHLTEILFLILQQSNYSVAFFNIVADQSNSAAV